MAVNDFVAKFAEEAAFLWFRRTSAVSSPHFSLRDLSLLDERLEAQIDGLRVARDAGGEASLCLLQSGSPEAVFPAAVLALETADEPRLEVIVEAVGNDEGKARALISAFGWLDYLHATPHIERFLAGQASLHRYIGIAATAIQRGDPGLRLEKATCDWATVVKARAVRAYGELGRCGELDMRRLRTLLNDADDCIRFWAAWSLALGRSHHADAVEVLKTFLLPKSPYWEDALKVSLRRMECLAALSCQKRLAESVDTIRLAIAAAGIIGDPVLVPWLIEQMEVPEFARCAGEAFTTITGVDISLEGMRGKRPEGFEAGPNDDPADVNVAMDADYDLPWPAPLSISTWWKTNRYGFPNGVRHLVGKPVSEDNLRRVLRTGLQRQRVAAAIELKLANPTQPLFEVRAPALRQRNLLTSIPGATIMTKHAATRSKNEVVITASNCITAVGHDGRITSASVRAGVSRFTRDDDYLDENDNAIVVAGIAGIEEERDLPGRIGTIAVKSLREMVDEFLRDTGRRTSQVHLLLGVSSAGRPGPRYAESCEDYLLAVAETLAKPVPLRVVARGNASMPHAIAEAREVLKDDPDALCIVGGIDSLLSLATLNWLHDDGRLKSASYGRHHGLIPGEAVSFLAIQDRARAEQAKTPILARVAGVGVAEEPSPRASSLTSDHSGLTEACRVAVATVNRKEIGEVFGDLNGEDARAREWSTVEMRLFQEGAEKRKLWRPASCYGDIGAASGAVSANIVIQGFLRGWLQSSALVFSSDDHGACGAVVLEKIAPY